LPIGPPLAVHLREGATTPRPICASPFRLRWAGRDTSFPGGQSGVRPHKLTAFCGGGSVPPLFVVDRPMSLKDDVGKMASAALCSANDLNSRHEPSSAAKACLVIPLPRCTAGAWTENRENNPMQSRRGLRSQHPSCAAGARRKWPEPDSIPLQEGTRGVDGHHKTVAARLDRAPALPV